MTKQVLDFCTGGIDSLFDSGHAGGEPDRTDQSSSRGGQAAWMSWSTKKGKAEGFQRDNHVMLTRRFDPEQIVGGLGVSPRFATDVCVHEAEYVACADKIVKDPATGETIIRSIYNHSEVEVGTWGPKTSYNGNFKAWYTDVYRRGPTDRQYQELVSALAAKGRADGGPLGIKPGDPLMMATCSC